MYDVDFKNIKKGAWFGVLFLFLGIVFSPFFLMVISTIFNSEFDLRMLLIVLPLSSVPLVFLCYGGKHIYNIYKRIKVVKYLNEHGTLVKGIPYHLEPTNTSINDRRVMKPVINYQLPNGQFVRLEGEGFHDFKERDEDGLVDMIIDEKNPELYFIDLEINRYTGNRMDDYYRENGVVIEASVPESELNQPSYQSDSDLPYKPL